MKPLTNEMIAKFATDSGISFEEARECFVQPPLKPLTDKMVSEFADELGIDFEQAQECFARLPAEEVLAKHADDVDGTIEEARISFAVTEAHKLRSILQSLRLALRGCDPIGKPYDSVSVYLSRERALELLETLEKIETANESAKKADLDDSKAQDTSAAAAIKKMETDLAYRMPGSGRPLSHIVSFRAGIENLLALVRQLQNGGLTFTQYAREAISTAIYPADSTISALAYLGLKLNGEAGEVAEKIGKAIRDNNGIVDKARRAALLDELGDVIWYVSAIAGELDSTFAEIAKLNLEKIASRKARGVVNGDGDNR
jgi:NTP pyrophosphatase (non-canonical NTP hydrolase)